MKADTSDFRLEAESGRAGQLRRLFDVAVASTHPAQVMAVHLPTAPAGRCVVVGAGKAAASMAAVVERAWPGVALSGVVAVPYGFAVPLDRIKVLEAAHPVPDENSVLAGRAIMDAVIGLSSTDLVLGLFSGGGSSTMVLPAIGLSLEDKRQVNMRLLDSGLDIRTINSVRRRLSAIKGGRLAAAAAPAFVFTLAISDIPGDDVAAIASGPTIFDDKPVDVSAIVTGLGGAFPEAVMRLLTEPASDPITVPSQYRMVATPAIALDAAAREAASLGINPVVLADDVEGASHEVAARMAQVVEKARSGPTVILSGGETTVSLESGCRGRGGRNTEFLLALALELDKAGVAPVWALSADTDGIDGNAGGAGAIITPDTLARARALGLDPARCLERHDSATFFDALGDLLVTGPTHTNVSDFRAILVT